MTRRFARSFHSFSFVALFIATFSVLALFATPATGQNPVPLVSQPLVPDATAPGGAGFTLTVNGAGFVSASVVNWNGSPRATTFVSSSQLTAAVQASDVAAASTASVTVVSPNPGGGVSNPVFFPINPPTTSVGFNTTNYAVGDDPLYATAADFRGDGNLDLAVANFDSGDDSSVSVMLGNGDGTFQSPVGYAIGPGPQTPVVGDFNGDGKLDLAVAYGGGGAPVGSSGVAVLLGNGDGTFKPAITYPSGCGVTDGITADFNGDGNLDFLTVNQCASTISILLGNGDGTFQPHVDYSVGSVPTEAATGDFNGDGKLDIAVSNWQSGTVSILLGNGDGTFQPAVTYGTGAAWGSNGVNIADMNGDGILDLVVPNEGPLSVSYNVGWVSVLLGKGDGTFATPVSYPLTGGAIRAEVGDFDQDGKLDVAVVTNSSTLEILLGNGDGTFQKDLSFPTANPWNVVAADFNKDGRLDAAVPATAMSAVSVMLRTPPVQTTPTTTTLVSSENPAPVHRSVIYTVSVASQYSGGATGTVAFQDGGVTVATVGVGDNSAWWAYAYGGGGGTHSITATYSGDANNLGSMSAVLKEKIEGPFGPNGTKTVVTTSGSPSLVGQAVTFTATVTSQKGAIPNGDTVTFFDQGAAIGSGTTAGGVATLTTSSLSAKMHTIEATYAGDQQFRTSSGTVTQVVNKYQTTTTVVSSLNPSVYGQSVTWTATVSTTGPNPPTGTVYFEGHGTATLSGGVASITRTWLNAGAQAITAEYKGDFDSAASTSSALEQVVNPASTATAITSSANPSTLGQNVTFTATVTSSTGAHATGTVTFTAGTTVLGTVPLEGIVATFSTAALPVGSFAITATYNGAPDFTGSSDTLVQSVQP
jgi:hypothetical protein